MKMEESRIFPSCRNEFSWALATLDFLARPVCMLGGAVPD
jgi:hypothetical protein